MSPSVDTGLADAVSRFIEEQHSALGPLMGATAGHAEQLRRDLALEAYNLAAAFIDADGLHTDAEIWAFVRALGEHFTDVIVGDVTPADVREAKLLDGRRSWLETASPFFAGLVDGDAASAGVDGHAKRYHDLALRVARTVISLDEYTSRAELTAVEILRSTLVAAMKAAPAAAPGSPGSPPKSTTVPDLAPARPLDELLAELDELIGLEPVKAEVRLVADLIQIQKLREQRGLKVVETSRHLVFVGNPGTGKSTVARLLAQIYRTLGVVDRGHLVETDRAGLVAGFVGQTAIKVTGVFDTADQGVLLIDEAYSLVRGGERDFGREAIDAVVKLVEDRRDRVVVIMAGYPDEMAALIDANPGLRSRFPKTIMFPDYTDDELVRIFGQLTEKAGYRLTVEAEATVVAYFSGLERGRGFGNGRAARNLFEAAIARHASRVVDVDSPTDDQLVELEAPDIPGPGAPDMAGLGATAPGDSSPRDTAPGDSAPRGTALDPTEAG